MSRDPYRYFRVEARETLEQMGRAVIALGSGRPETASVTRLLRQAHTLKGAARVVRQAEIADLAHQIEGLLAPFREVVGPVPREAADGTLERLDAIAALVAKLTPVSETGGAGATRPEDDESFEPLRADVSEMDAVLGGIAETQASLAELRPVVDSVRRAQRLAASLEGSATPRSGDGRGPAGRPDAPQSRIRAEELRQLADAVERRLSGGLERAERELVQLRDSAEKLRLFPARSLFPALERTVYDAARTLDRRAVFRGSGGEVRVESSILTVIQRALVQIVRNAVAHGIEGADERGRAGKRAEGAVTLEVALRGRRVAFVCGDDGRGVDLQAVRAALERKGLPTGELHGLGTEQVLRRLLAGGISTSGAVTEVSGRGLGLDVVREAVSTLGGDVTVRTRTGEGTTVELVVPVSLSALDALSVGVGAAVAAIPLAAVRRAVRLPSSAIRGTNGGSSVLLDGVLMPFVPLGSVLGTAAAGPVRPDAWSAVVVGEGERLAAVGVDRLLATASIVVRSLPRLAPARPVVAGTFLDATGAAQLVLDPEHLVSAAGKGVKGDDPEREAPPRILIVDDSLTTRMLEQSILETAGYQVDLASSAEEALQKASRWPYGLFLVDVEMPGMDGFELLEKLRSEPALRDIPSILVTSRTSAEDRRRGEQAGARAYMAKNEFDQAELLRRIRSLLG